MRDTAGCRTVVLLLAIASLVGAAGCAGEEGGRRSAAASPARSSTTTTPDADGRFQVHDTEILDPWGQTFVPRGVNLLGPQSFWRVPTAGLATAVRDWGLNAVRLTTCLPGGCDDAEGAVHEVNDDLDGLVEELTGNRIVVVIALHQIAPGRFPDDAEYATIRAWWRAVATRYASNPYVWFNLLNEPGSDIPVADRWRNVHEGLIDVVRSVAPNIIVVDGTQYGQEAGPGGGEVTEETSAILSDGPALHARAPDLVFSLHVYDQWSAAGADAHELEDRLEAFVEAVAAAGLPLLIGETGGPAHDPDGRLARATRGAYAVAAEHGLGLFAWHGQARDDFSLVEAGDDPTATFADRDRYPLTWHGELLWDLVHASEEDPEP